MSSKASRRRNRRSLQRALRGEVQAPTERRTDNLRPASCAVFALDCEPRNLYPSPQAIFEDRMLRGGFGRVPVKMTGAEYILRGRTTYREHDGIAFRRDRRDIVPYKRDFYGPVYRPDKEPKEPKEPKAPKAQDRTDLSEIRADNNTDVNEYLVADRSIRYQ